METYIALINNSRIGEIMQVNTWDPLTSVLLFLGFLTLILVIGYFKGLLWFQQTGTNATDNWFVSFQQRDLASGGWFHRFGRPVIVLHIVVILSYPVITNLVVLSPFQFVIYILVFYIPIQLILVIISFAIIARVNRQPESKENKA